jgi:hypothetical protein
MLRSVDLRPEYRYLFGGLDADSNDLVIDLDYLNVNSIADHNLFVHFSSQN